MNRTLDADDVWRAGGLQARWAVAESEPDAQWIAADFQVFSEGEQPLQYGTTLARTYPSDAGLRLHHKEVDAAGQASRRTSECHLVCSPTVMVECGLLQEVGGFDERLDNGPGSAPVASVGSLQ